MCKQGQQCEAHVNSPWSNSRQITQYNYLSLYTENQIVIWGAETDYSENDKKTWVMQLNDNELKQETYAHGQEMKLIRAQIACATKPPITPSNNVIFKISYTHLKLKLGTEEHIRLKWVFLPQWPFAR